MSKTDEQCPLCGGPNACAVAKSGDDEKPCWCRQAAISKEAIARVPLELRGVACICPQCAAVTEKASVVVSVVE